MVFHTYFVGLCIRQLGYQELTCQYKILWVTKNLLLFQVIPDLAFDICLPLFAPNALKIWGIWYGFFVCHPYWFREITVRFSCNTCHIPLKMFSFKMCKAVFLFSMFEVCSLELFCINIVAKKGFLLSDWCFNFMKLYTN